MVRAVRSVGGAAEGLAGRGSDGEGVDSGRAVGVGSGTGAGGGLFLAVAGGGGMVTFGPPQAATNSRAASQSAIAVGRAGWRPLIVLLLRCTMARYY